MKFDVHLAHEHEHAHGITATTIRTITHHASRITRMTHHHDDQRNFAEIKKLISRSKLSAWVKQKSIAVFQRIAEAEGKIHGLPPNEVHFHEVGAVDSIVDIVGAAIALELLGKPRVFASPVVEGTGWIQCAHGRFPVPAPATLAILGARGNRRHPMRGAARTRHAHRRGAAGGICRELRRDGKSGRRKNRLRPRHARQPDAAECPARGAGNAVQSRKVQSQSRRTCHRHLSPVTWIGKRIASPCWKPIWTIAPAKFSARLSKRRLAAGALDVFHTPIQMKKNRPGVLLTVLCAEDDADKFCELILRETTAFGVRKTIAERRKLRREFAEVKTAFGKVTVKIGRLGGKVVQAAPEFESAKKAGGAKPACR